MDKHGRMDCMKIYDKNDLMSLPNGVWGIKEPGAVWQGEPRSRGNIVPVSVDRTRRWFWADELWFFWGKALDSPDLDVILLPAVAFGRDFARLGHGKGYYDRFITSYHGVFHHKPVLGLCVYSDPDWSKQCSSWSGASWTDSREGKHSDGRQRLVYGLDRYPWRSPH